MSAAANAKNVAKKCCETDSYTNWLRTEQFLHENDNLNLIGIKEIAEKNEMSSTLLQRTWTLWCLRGFILNHFLKNLSSQKKIRKIKQIYNNNPTLQSRRLLRFTLECLFHIRLRVALWNIFMYTYTCGCKSYLFASGTFSKDSREHRRGERWTKLIK